MEELSLWRCDDGTYDLCEAGEVCATNIPAATLYEAKALRAMVAELMSHECHDEDRSLPCPVGERARALLARTQ